MNIAVIGAGISGLSAAWLLASRHNVTLFEAAARPGGHSNTVRVGDIPVDTGFIVYNEATYPNLCALFRHLDVPTQVSDMSFALSLDAGSLEYAGTNLNGLFAQRSNLFNPRFWRMLKDLLRFYRDAGGDLDALGATSLDDYLRVSAYGSAFRDLHLYPMAAAIWSTPACDIGSTPAASLLRFFINHGLLKLTGRPAWRTVTGGSRVYVDRLLKDFSGRLVLGAAVTKVRRTETGIELHDDRGRSDRFDQVVIAAHADQALRLLADASSDEKVLLSAFSYRRNDAVLHKDARLMPKRRAAWSSWNYLGTSSPEARDLSVTYWMNKLQALPTREQIFVTLNPTREPASPVQQDTYEHPVFAAAAIAAQKRLWSLQGQRNTWFCGAYFGAGFHEDGLQAGLAVAEALGGVRRPWRVEGESSRITVLPLDDARRLQAARA